MPGIHPTSITPHQGFVLYEGKETTLFIPPSELLRVDFDEDRERPLILANWKHGKVWIIESSEDYGVYRWDLFLKRRQEAVVAQR
ncbi:hypothetical protein TNIN_273531 [Trichonephila inaurata madagascariensis]|uniref:Uncharacterized protein n=1 Tax=Trichonephila inaurata madagascariensis TaxID=2747483 RepID=A0A8X7CJH3_9ARAC|nr:hypothetical protein TNIN_273531 [Trichonephila inaurata madagascariensis]